MSYVWLVVDVDYEDQEVLGVLSSEAEAVARARDLTAKDPGLNIVVEKHAVDAPETRPEWFLVEWRVPSLDPPQRATFMGSYGYP